MANEGISWGVGVRSSHFVGTAAGTLQGRIPICHALSTRWRRCAAKHAPISLPGMARFAMAGNGRLGVFGAKAAPPGPPVRARSRIGAGAVGHRHPRRPDPGRDGGRTRTLDRAANERLGRQRPQLGCVRSGLQQRLSAIAAGLAARRCVGEVAACIRAPRRFRAAGLPGRARQDSGRCVHSLTPPAADRSRQRRRPQLRAQGRELGAAPDRQAQCAAQHRGHRVRRAASPLVARAQPAGLPATRCASCVAIAVQRSLARLPRR